MIYRLPPYQIVSRPLSVAQLGEKVDWGLLAHNVPDAWKFGQGTGVTVAILDTGAAEHPDLPDPVFAHDFTRSRSGAEDRHGHATHCAGIVGARSNEIGVVGVAKNCRLGYCKVLADSGSGSSAGIARGIDRAAEEGAHVISLSLGGGYDADTHQACKRASDAGIVVIAAAGNAGYRGRDSVDYPGKLRETLCVAAYNRAGNISNFSSGGDAVDVAAPGEDILSTYLRGKYIAMSGTSMATPFIAGLVALILSATTLPNTASIRELFSRHATDHGAPGKDVRWGWGAPDLAGLLDAVTGDDDHLWI